MSRAVRSSRDLPVRVTGDPVVWARDLALIGAVSGFFAIWGVFGTVALAAELAAAAGGAAGGAALGAVLPGALDRLRGRVSLPVLAVMTLPAGFAWGALSGWAAAGPLTTVFDAIDLTTVLIVVAGIAGALQLGWFWFPYTFQTVRGGRRWPLVLAACAVTPALGWLAASAFLWAGALL